MPRWPPVESRSGSRDEGVSEAGGGRPNVTVRPLELDRYGRTVAEVILPDGRSLNHEMVRNLRRQAVVRSIPVRSRANSVTVSSMPSDPETHRAWAWGSSCWKVPDSSRLYQITEIAQESFQGKGLVGIVPSDWMFAIMPVGIGRGGASSTPGLRGIVPRWLSKSHGCR